MQCPHLENYFDECVLQKVQKCLIHDSVLTDICVSCSNSSTYKHGLYTSML